MPGARRRDSPSRVSAPSSSAAGDSDGALIEKASRALRSERMRCRVDKRAEETTRDAGRGAPHRFGLPQVRAAPPPRAPTAVGPRLLRTRKAYLPAAASIEPPDRRAVGHLEAGGGRLLALQERRPRRPPGLCRHLPLLEEGDRLEPGGGERRGLGHERNGLAQDLTALEQRAQPGVEPLPLLQPLPDRLAAGLPRRGRPGARRPGARSGAPRRSPAGLRPSGGCTG